jgi:hypothetical protein
MQVKHGHQIHMLYSGLKCTLSVRGGQEGREQRRDEREDGGREAQFRCSENELEVRMVDGNVALCETKK